MRRAGSLRPRQVPKSIREGHRQGKDDDKKSCFPGRRLRDKVSSGYKGHPQGDDAAGRPAHHPVRGRGGRGRGRLKQPAFLTVVRSEAVETGMDTRRRDRGHRRRSSHYVEEPDRAQRSRHARIRRRSRSLCFASVPFPQALSWGSPAVSGAAPDRRCYNGLNSRGHDRSVWN